MAGGQNAFRREPALVERQQNIRIGLDLITRDLQNAGAGITAFSQAFTTGLDNPSSSLGSVPSELVSGERADFLARHWGRDAEGGGVVLRSDPAHKLINATLYRLDEARACWERVAAPVLWIDAAESETRTRMKLTPEALAERRAAFKDLKHHTVRDAGHMLHHDRPDEVARLIEEFLV